jgi:hypothetical protein
MNRKLTINEVTLEITAYRGCADLKISTNRNGHKDEIEMTDVDARLVAHGLLLLIEKGEIYWKKGKA